MKDETVYTKRRIAMLKSRNIGLYTAEASLIDRFRTAAVTAWDKNIVPKGIAGTPDIWYETARKVVGSDKSTGYLALQAIQNLFHAFDGVTAADFAGFLICHNQDVKDYRAHIDVGRKTKDPFYLLNTAFYYENSADLEKDVCFDDDAAAAAVSDFLRKGRPALSETTIRKLLFRESISHNQIELALRFLYCIGHLDKQKGGRGNTLIYFSNGILELWLNDYLASFDTMFHQEEIS
jgi:hypothetical protein